MPKHSFRSIFLAGLLLALPQTALAQSDAPQPSFNCARAGNAAERMICADYGLAALDREMARVYGNIMNRLPGGQASTLRNDQRNWIRMRNGCGNSLNCLDQSYRLRLDYLLAVYR